MEKVLFDHDTITRSLKRIAHEILEKNDIDYHVFDDDVQAKMRGILYEVLTSDEISESTKYYDFLTPKKETEAEQRQDAPACE